MSLGVKSSAALGPEGSEGLGLVVDIGADGFQ